TAQVLAQHAGAVGGVDVPRAAAAAVADRPGAVAPGLRVEPARIDLPQLRGVEQNRADATSTAAGAERRQACGSIERGHPASLASACLPIPLFRPCPPRPFTTRSACCACRRWATPPTSCRWCARCGATGPALR